jgi:phytoene synthase
MSAEARFPEVVPREVVLTDPQPQRRGRGAGEGIGASAAFDPAALMSRSRRENFVVAGRLLGDPLRRDLLAVYGFARLTDELGDSLVGDRSAALDWLEGELELAYEGSAEHPLLRALTPTLHERGLQREPFLRLIAANRRDQRQRRYESLDELLEYCSLSANPVGELVLGVFGLATPERVALSDRICSGLQIAEHLQDVAEDRRVGRIYLPERDMRHFGVVEADLDGANASPALRELLAFEVDRARAMLLRGAPLLATLPWRARLAVAAYLGGGLAALDGIEEAEYDVLAAAPRARRSARALLAAQLLTGSLAHPGASRRGAATVVGPSGASVQRGYPSARPGALDAAHRACERITRREARNFYYGIRLLPPLKRRAMCAVYAFARRVDDIGDGELGLQQKLERLDALSRDLEVALAVEASSRAGPSSPAQRSAASPDMHHGGSRTTGPALEDDPVLAALADAQRQFDLPVDALVELVEGVRMDVHGVHYERFDDLLVYCRRVAGGIGRLCLCIFGVKESRAAGWASSAADELGVAMQLTNILRDLREDAQRGRLYLPREDLIRFGLIVAEAPHDRVRSLFERGVREDELRALIEFEARRAREWFARGISLVPQLDRRSAACVLAMVGIYSRLLEHIAERPAEALEARLSLPAREKAWVAARSLLGALA